MLQATLYFMDVLGNWLVAPNWAEFFLHLGLSIAHSDANESRVVVGLAVPTKAYAAALTSAGIVMGRSHVPNTQAQIDAHFAQLCGLPLGARLFYRRLGKKRLQAVFAGVQIVEGEQRIKVRTEADKSSGWLLTPELAQYVDVDVAAHRSARLPAQQAGRPVEGPSQLASAFLGHDAANMIAVVSRLECTIVGPLARLRQEIQATQFAAGPATYGLAEPEISPASRDQPQPAQLNQHIGNLQGVLRAAKLLPIGEAYRSDIVSSHASRSELALSEAPMFVVFDGASSFLRAREEWRQSHWVVVLDQTERDFSDAVHAFDQQYIKYRLEPTRQPQIGTIPPGVDVVVYQEARQ